MEHPEYSGEHCPPFVLSEALQVAFTKLNEMGIIAKHHYWCCGSCGVAAIDVPTKPDGTIGYCFYHQQAAEQAAQSGILSIHYGDTYVDSPDATRKIISCGVAYAIVETLQESGIEAIWDGDTGTAIRAHVGGCDYDGWMCKNGWQSDDDTDVDDDDYSDFSDGDSLDEEYWLMRGMDD